MANNVIVFFGISGVGKTTFLKQTLDSVDFLHLQASELIKMQIATEVSEKLTSDQLRKGNIENNQMKLAMAFSKATKDYNGTIVLDGHSMIDTPDKLTLIAPNAIAPLNPTTIVFLEDLPETIFQRRLADLSRKRPVRSALELQRHQEIAFNQAKLIADDLSVPIISLSTDDLNNFISLL